MASLWRFKDRLRKYNRHKPTINAQLQRVFPKSGASRLTVRRLFRLVPLRERSVWTVTVGAPSTRGAGAPHGEIPLPLDATCLNPASVRFYQPGKPCAAPPPASYSGSKPPCYEAYVKSITARRESRAFRRTVNSATLAASWMSLQLHTRSLVSGGCAYGFSAVLLHAFAACHLRPGLGHLDSNLSVFAQARVSLFLRRIRPLWHRNREIFFNEFTSQNLPFDVTLYYEISMPFLRTAIVTALNACVWAIILDALDKRSKRLFYIRSRFLW